MTEGVDYAGSHPNITQLAAAGRVFACRYGGPGGSWKHLTPAEAQALSNAGVAVVANAEGSADGLLGGFSAGASWARDAESHFRSCGMPPGKPIYFSVDFDVSSGQWPTVASALRGAASVLGGVHRVGVYGGRRAMELARRDGVARWFWQTFAWSSGVWVPGNHIEQYRIGVSLAGATLDLDRALTSDYGQWKIGIGEEDDMSEWSESDPYGPDPDGHNRTPAQKQRDDHAALFFGARPVTETGQPVGPEPWIVAKVNEIEAKLNTLSVPAPAPVDIPALVAALRPELVAAAEAAVRKVLGGLDETRVDQRQDD